MARRFLVALGIAGFGALAIAWPAVAFGTCGLAVSSDDGISCYANPIYITDVTWAPHGEAERPLIC